MGMCGNYIAVSNDELRQIKDGTTGIYDLCELSQTDGRDITDIDKAWDMMSFTFTGETFGMGTSPEYCVVPMLIDQTLERYSDEFNAFYLSEKQVQEVSDYLSDVDKETLRAKFNHDELVANEVYGVSEDDAEGDFEYMLEYVFSLKNFYKKVAEKKQAVIFWIC